MLTPTESGCPCRFATGRLGTQQPSRGQHGTARAAGLTEQFSVLLRTNLSRRQSVQDAFGSGTGNVVWWTLPGFMKSWEAGEAGAEADTLLLLLGHSDDKAMSGQGRKAAMSVLGERMARVPLERHRKPVHLPGEARVSVSLSGEALGP